jgi:DNA mismatch repair protein MutL
MTIKRLPEDVVNRIAAGEVIVRPVNAIKEMIENSIDANATEIAIIVGNGGLQSIHVIDNGSGITKKDLPLVCERFATSKLRAAEELTRGKILSFGFRGEALASISLVAHVSILSKAREDGVATGFESRYISGALVEGYPVPSPFSGESGTRIVVDDLFFNNVVRKKAFRSTTTEYKKILEMVSRFAICFPSVSFRVRKTGMSDFDLVEEDCERLDRIESLTGHSKSCLVELLLSSEDSGSETPAPLLSSQCICLNPSAISKSISHTTAILVINGRLMETSSSHLLKNVENEICSNFDCAKAGFLYICLNLNPEMVDVNVCPTKGKVVFTNQAGVENFVSEKLISFLLEKRKATIIKLHKIEFASSNLVREQSPLCRPSQLPPPSQESQPFKVRTCPKQNFFFTPKAVVKELSQEIPFIELTLTQPDVTPPVLLDLASSNENEQTSLIEENLPLCIQSTKPDPPFKSTFSLTLAELANNRCVELGQNPRDFVFVGDIGRGYILCQYFSRLCVCNVNKLSRALLESFLLGHDLGFVPIPAETFPEENLRDCSGFVKDLFVGPRCPSVRGNHHRIGPYQVKKLLSEIGANAENLRTESEDSIVVLTRIIVDWILEAEYDDDMRIIWDEIVRNKNFLANCTISKTQEPPELINEPTSHNSFFREVISLKELYKEFERC